jgi:hypothetical protein
MHIFSPIPDQDSDIMRPMNPILPNDEFDPVVNMGGIPRLDGIGNSPMDALSVLSFADMILNG